MVFVAVIGWAIGGFGGSDQPPVGETAADSTRSATSRPVVTFSKPTSASPSTTSRPPSSRASSPASSSAPARSPGPPRACPDAAIKVLAETGAPAYRVGQRPLLRLVVVNTGTVPCQREVSRTLRELVVTTADGKNRLWSSNDCYSPPGVDSRLLQPGERLSFTVSWAGRTSAPGCPSARDMVPAGNYLITGKLGPLTSPPVVLQLN